MFVEFLVVWQDEEEEWHYEEDVWGSAEDLVLEHWEDLGVRDAALGLCAIIGPADRRLRGPSQRSGQPRQNAAQHTADIDEPNMEQVSSRFFGGSYQLLDKQV